MKHTRVNVSFQHLSKRIIIISAATLFLTMLFCVNTSAAPRHKVLFISSYHPGFPTFFQQVDGIKAVFDKKNISIDIEFMDTKRFPEKTNWENFEKTLSYKLKQSNEYQAIIVADDNALIFALAQQTKLFAGKPIVFLGVNNITRALEQNKNDQITGVVEAVSMEETIRLMIKLQPRAKRIVALVDNTPSGQGDLKTFYQLSEKISSHQFSDISLSKMTWPEFLREVGQLGKESAVLLLSAYKDKSNQTVSFEKSLQKIKQDLSVPLFHLWSHGLGDGITGGKIISHFEQGRVAAGIVSDILDGTPVKSIKVVNKSPNKFVVDYSEIKKFKLNKSKLPHDCIILNEPYSFYKTNEHIIIGFATIIIVLSICLFLAIMNNLRRKQVEKALQQSLDFNQQILSNSPVGISIYNADTGQCVEASNSIGDLIGATKEQILSQNFKNIESWKKSGLLNSAMTSLTENENTKAEVNITSTFGKNISAACQFAPFSSRGQKYLLFALTDISELKQAENDLKLSEERFQLLAENIPEVLWMTDIKSRSVLFVSHAYERISGKSCETLYKNPADFISLLHPDDKAATETLMEQKFGKEAFESEYRIIQADGNVRWIRDRGWPISDESGDIYRLAGIAEDITQQILFEKEKEELEAQIQQAQKMEAIATLAGGIAHDFNNLISVITGNISYVLPTINRESELFEVLTDVEKGAKQAQNLTQQLLTFSKGGEPVKKLSDINLLVEEAAQFVIRGKSARCEFSLSRDVFPVEIDSGQMHQVIGNLVINASQSMPDGGIIYIKTENIRIEEPGLQLTEGEYVKISIEDQGTGISDKHLAKIFDPFFTTKQKGSGIGLSTAYSIVQKHNGHITVSSEIEKGTVFDIYLPASSKPIEKKIKKAVAPHNGQGKILIMDDQVSVLKMIERMLNKMGYKTDSVTDGKEAVEKYEAALSSGEPFDLVILDLTVPGGMGGLNTVKELLKIDSEVKAVVSSGYSNDPIMANYENYGFCNVVPKPYTKTDLSEVLNQVFGT